MIKENIKKFVEDNPSLVYRKPVDNGMYLLKYKNRVFYDNLWNDILVECRGTIVDGDYNIISRPFTKIFNYTENNTVIPDDEWCVSYKKINGFMASITVYNDELLISTTGTIDSEFAWLAAAILAKHCNMSYIQDYCKRENVTLIVEICSPDDPHIINENEGVYLLGERYNDWDTPQNNFPILQSHRDYLLTAELMKMIPCERVTSTFGAIKVLAKEAVHEGFVVYGENGTNLKLKSPYYLITKFLARKNPEKLEKLIDKPELLKQTVDEEFYPLIDKICLDKYAFLKYNEQDRITYIRKFLNE